MLDDAALVAAVVSPLVAGLALLVYCAMQTPRGPFFVGGIAGPIVVPVCAGIALSALAEASAEYGALYVVVLLGGPAGAYVGVGTVACQVGSRPRRTAASRVMLGGGSLTVIAGAVLAVHAMGQRGTVDPGAACLMLIGVEVLALLTGLGALIVRARARE